jgi:extracellular elastinolytic metalloproteinase
VRTSPRAFTRTTAFLVTGIVVLAFGSAGQAAPPSAGARVQTQMAPGDHVTPKIKDNRVSKAEPSANQRRRAGQLNARVRWNALGTPAVLASTGAPLATGLAADPARAALDYIAANRDVLGLTESGAAALEVLTVAPMGLGSAVLLRQRFGGLNAAVDGMMSIGIRDGSVWYLTSSLAPDGKAPEPATLTTADAERIAKTDAGVAEATIAATKLVAVPTPDRGPPTRWCSPPT